MSTRYLGSDEAQAKLTTAIATATESTLDATSRIGKAVNASIGSVIEGQESLSKLEMQRQEAVIRANQGSAIGQFAEAAGKGVAMYAEVLSNDNQRKQRSALEADKLAQEKLQFDARQKQEQDKLNAETRQAELKQQSEVQFGTAADELSTLQQTYIRDNWGSGVLNFKAQAAKIVAKYPSLTPQQVNDLIDRANKVATERDTQVSIAKQEDTDKLANAQAATTGETFLVGITGDVEYIRKMAPTTQATPYLEQLSKKIEDFVRSDNGMTQAQKYEYAAKAITNLRGAYADKAGNFGKFDSDMRAIEEWRVVGSKLYAEFTTGKITLAEYKNGLARLKITTGKDFSGDLVAPGEQEQMQANLVGNLNSISRIQQEAQTKAGLNFNLGDDVVNGIAAGLIVSPGLETNILANPTLANNPNVKQAIEIGKRIRAANEDAAKLGVDRADFQKNIVELDLSDARNVAELTRSIVNKTSAGKQLNPKEQYVQLMLQQMAQINPAVLQSLQQIEASVGSKQNITAQEIQQLQQTLQTESAGIARVKQAVVDQYTVRFQEYQQKYADLVQRFGRIPSNTELAEYYKQAAPNVQKRIELLQQTINEAGAAAVTPYGQTSNFSTAGGNIAASRQPDGRYTVAPRTALQVQTRSADGGSAFITPVQAGVVAPHSFNRGHMGGGYKAGRDKGRQHAGVDFPLNSGQKAMTVVSGTVIKVANDKGYGGYIDVQGDNGSVYRYTHLRPYVKVGQRLGAGEAVGTPNGSGAGAHHLHFEVRDGAAYHNGSQYGISGTVDPIAHLRTLTALAGTNIGNTAGKVRGQQTQAVTAYAPQAKANNNSIFVLGGGVLQANLFQQIGKPTIPAAQAFTPQRPLSVGGSGGWVAGTPTYNENDDMGFAYLRNNPDVRVAMHRAAKELGVPTTWIGDIVAQETGNFALATKYHNNGGNRNFGLFGFGSDSGVPNYDRLSPVQQVQAYVGYMKRNGWIQARQRLGANATLAQFWAITRMGVNWRNQILNGRDPNTLKLNDSGKTYADELRMLGNHAGREYAVPGGARSGRARRNSAVRKRADTNLGQAVAANNSYDVYTREA